MRTLRLSSLPGRAAVAVVALLACIGSAALAASEGPFWKVTGANGTAWLMGSLHFGREGMYPLSPIVNDAFEASDRLAVEINLNAMDPQLMAGWITSHGAYLDGTTLADHVSPAVWNALQQRAAEYGAPLDQLSVYRPWWAAFMLTTLALIDKGFSEDLGVDRHFLTRARGRIPVVELEDFEQQLKLLSDLSPESQERFLAVTLDDLSSESRTFERIIRAWERGDAGRLDKEINAGWQADSGGRALYKRLIENRNAAMSEKIARLLEAGGTTFVVVGAAHMVGEGGVARRLEERGFEVEKK